MLRSERPKTLLPAACFTAHRQTHKPQTHKPQTHKPQTDQLPISTLEAQSSPQLPHVTSYSLLNESTKKKKKNFPILKSHSSLPSPNTYLLNPSPIKYQNANFKSSPYLSYLTILLPTKKNKQTKQTNDIIPNPYPPQILKSTNPELRTYKVRP